MARILLAFLLIPIVELLLLIEIGQRVGTLPTLALIVATGTLGAWLVRRQGLTVLDTMRRETAEGRVPAGAMVDGVLILLAGAVLLTPGVLTDLFGFACLIPAARNVLKRELRRRFESRGTASTFTVGFGPGAPGFGTGRAPSAREVRDITPPHAARDPRGPERSGR